MQSVRDVQRGRLTSGLTSVLPCCAGSSSARRIRPYGAVVATRSATACYRLLVPVRRARAKSAVLLFLFLMNVKRLTVTEGDAARLPRKESSPYSPFGVEIL